jgi:N-acetylglutamate synthase-like GNAT family acetyltransferase
MTLEIRDVRKEDLSKIKEIIAEAWHAKHFIPNERIIDAGITLMFLSPVLNKSTFGKAAVTDGEVVGVIFGSREDEVQKYKMLLENYTSEIIEILSLEKEEQHVFMDLTQKTNQAYAELMAGKEAEFQGCLEFFALSEKARGKQIGKKLLNEFLAYQKEKQAQKIYVYTDTMSNYGFYEHMGFVRRGENEQVFDLGEEKMANNNFIYEYVI